MGELYLIEVSYRDRAGRFDQYFPERDTSDLTRAETVKDIRTGQYEDVNRVIAIDLDKGAARDATKEIAQEILDSLDELPLRFLQEFLEHVLGCQAIASVIREMKAA